MHREVPTHYLRPNEAVRSPKRVMFADTETIWTNRPDGEHHRLRVWSTTFVRRDLGLASKKRRDERDGHTADELADVVEDAGSGKDALWLYFHNLSFDLAVTRLPAILVKRGWELYRHALTTTSPWASLRRAEHHIHICDSFSWLPKSMAEIGETLDLEKTPLPDNLSEDEAWFLRCRADVRILERAMLSLMDEWDDRRAGVWGVTGTGSGFSHMRHIGDKRHVVIRPDERAQVWERGGISGGRRELWYRGILPNRLFVNIDARHAFATICRDCLLPVDRWRERESTPLDYYDLGREERQLMADCLVETARPRYPAKLGHSWFYPVGRFWSRLAGPELEEARGRGELLRIGRGYKYVMGRFMRPWAEEVCEVLDRPACEPKTPWVMAVKNWSRSVPGRWALRTGRVEDETIGYGLDWSIEPAVYGRTFAPAAILTIPPMRQIIVRDNEAENSFPAVLAFIQSLVRVRLNRLIDLLGASVVQCNTDGVVFDAESAPNGLGEALRLYSGRDDAVRDIVTCWLSQYAERWAPLTFEVRKIFYGGQTITPQHAILGEEQRLAGIPGKAKRVGPASWAFTTWSKLPTQISADHPGVFVVGNRAVNLSQAPTNRLLTADGTCLPVRISQEEPQAVPTLVQPNVFETVPHGGLAELQHPWIARQLTERV